MPYTKSIARVLLFAAIAFTSLMAGVVAAKNDPNLPDRKKALTDEGATEVQVKLTVPDDPAGTVEAVAHGLANKQPQILWAALPTKHQNDVNRLVHAFAAKMDKDIYDKTFALIKKMGAVAKNKKQMFLKSPLLNSTKIDKKKLEKNWDHIVGLFDTLAESDVGTIEKLKKVDVGAALAKSGPAFMEHLAGISAVNSNDKLNQQLDDLAKIEVVVVKQESNEATVKTTVGNKTETGHLTKVDGKWLPREMAEDWDKEFAQAHKQIEKMDFSKSKLRVMQTLAAADTALDAINGAKNQKEFDGVLENATQQMGMVVFGILMGAAN